jgi:tetratricopeptide (TPR) repeat protein
MRAQPPKPPMPSRVSSVGWASPELPSGSTPDATTFATLQADLERARGEYGLRRYDSAWRILAGLLSNLNVVIQTPFTGETPIESVWPKLSTLSRLASNLESEVRAVFRDKPQPEQAFFLASVLCLLGRLLRQAQDLEWAARDLFAQAVSLFERHKTEITAQKSSLRLYTDYGIALYRTDQILESISILKQTCEGGAAPPEAFGYLGFGYKRLSRWAEAEEALKKSLQLAPGDPVFLQHLAETLDKAGKNDEAVSAYCDAAAAAWRIEKQGIAAQLAQRALEIAPTDLPALIIAVEIQHAQRNYDAAIAIVDGVLEHEPKHAWALGMKGVLLHARGDLHEGINTLRSIDVQTPDLAWVLVALAQMLHQLGSDHDAKALVLLDRALELNPREADALHAQAQIELDCDQVSHAVEALRQAIDIEPQSATLQCTLGRALFRSGDFAAAEQAFDKALRLDPKSTAALAGKAEVLQAEDRGDQALSLLRLALRLDPDDQNIFVSLINLLLEQDRVEDALAELDLEIKRKPEQDPRGPYARAFTYWLKGRVLLDTTDLKGAAEAFETATRIAPDNADFHYDLANTWCRLDDYDKAGKEYERVVQLQPNSATAIGAKAYYLADIADFQEAVRLVKDAIQKAPGEAWLWGFQGWCLQNLGRSFADQARHAFEQACKAVKREGKKVDDSMYRKGLADALCLLRREDEAKVHFEALIEEQKYEEGNDADILELLGWCHYRLGHYDEAARLLQAAFSITDNPVAVQFDLALTLLASGRREFALTEYQYGIDLASKKHLLRQRGLYYIALFDLVEAAEDGRIKKDGQSAFELLRTCLGASGVPLHTLPWLGARLPDRPMA